MSTEQTLMTADANGEGASEVAAAGADTQTATTNSTEGADTQPGGGASTEGGQDSLAGGEESTSGEDSLSGAPEAYDDFTAPDGIELDTEVLDDFKATAKELNLPQEAAQRVVDLGIALIQKASDANATLIAEAQQGWITASKTDPEFGGDKLNESLALSRKGLEAVGTPELTKLLDESGLGNHPEVIRAFVKVGKAYSEDGFVSGNGGEARSDSAAKRMYPSMAPTN